MSPPGCCYFLLFLLLATPSSTAPASRKSNPSSSSPTSSPASWSKKSALAPLPDTELVPFVTSRVERVPRPEDSSPQRRPQPNSRGPPDDWSAPRRPSASENTIDHEEDHFIYKDKSKNGNGRRRWGPNDGYNVFDSSYAGFRKTPNTFIHKVQVPYQRSPGHDSTSSVTSSTIAVSPIRYKIIDMGDPWVRWPPTSGYNPHEHHLSRPYRQGDGLYGQDSYWQQQPYGGGGQYGAYSTAHDSVIDPFRQGLHPRPRDVVPWSVQVGTSLTVNDDGRRSRRQYYVQSQRRIGEEDDDMMMG